MIMKQFDATGCARRIFAALFPILVPVLGCMLLLTSCTAEGRNPMNTPTTENTPAIESAAPTVPEKEPPAEYKASVLKENYQTIRYWGCFPSYFRSDWGEEWHLFGRPEIQKAVFQELGVNLIRVDLQPRCYDETTGELNPTAMSDLKKQLEIARSFGIKEYMISIWSPPAVMKDPPDINGRTPDGKNTSLRKDKESDFIRYCIQALKWLESEGVGLPVAFSFQNEPTHNPTYDACVYEGEQYVRMVKKFKKALVKNKLDTVKLIAGEGNTYLHNHAILGDDYSWVAEDEELSRSIDILATHSYDQWGTHPDVLKRYRDAVTPLGKPLWMTEWSPISYGSTQLEYAMNTLLHFNRDLICAPHEAWIYWRTWTKNGKPEEDLLAGDQVPEKHKAYYILSKVWKSAPPGSIVKRMSTDCPYFYANDSIELNMMALENSDGMTVILVNPLKKETTLTIDGLAGNSARVFRTSETEDMAGIGEGGILEGKYRVVLPAGSIVVVVTR